MPLPEGFAEPRVRDSFGMVSGTSAAPICHCYTCAGRRASVCRRNLRSGLKINGRENPPHSGLQFSQRSASTDGMVESKTLHKCMLAELAVRCLRHWVWHLDTHSSKVTCRRECRCLAWAFGRALLRGCEFSGRHLGRIFGTCVS